MVWGFDLDMVHSLMLHAMEVPRVMLLAFGTIVIGTTFLLACIAVGSGVNPGSAVCAATSIDDCLQLLVLREAFPLGTVIETARGNYLLVLTNLSNVTLSSTLWTGFPLSPFLLDVRICGSNKTHCPTIGSTCLLTTSTTVPFPTGFALWLAG